MGDNPNLPPPQPPAINVRLVQDPPPPLLDLPPLPPSVPSAIKKSDEFYKHWDRFVAERPNGKSSKKAHDNRKKTPFTSLDADPEGKPSHRLRRDTLGQFATQSTSVSYDEAASTCRKKVRAIVNECERLNVKYTDRNFNLQPGGPWPDALVSLDSIGDPPPSVKGLQGIGDVKRVGDIYEKPQFIVDGATANDVRQGYLGDCWFLAAITALSGKKDLIERVCVDRNEKVGVYGFVFFRDGEWISEVVDDTLALKYADEQRQFPTEFLLNVPGDKHVQYYGIPADAKLGYDYVIQKLQKEYKEGLRKGSNSLYFASCRETNETWLPLLEKAYAKAHGDYQSIDGGSAGEGIEDLTGGVSTFFFAQDVLDKDNLWKELLQVNEESGFLFGCGSRFGEDYRPSDDEGFVRGHAYSVLAAREIKDPKDDKKTLRLLKIRNPWGKTEWNGAWSDGSKEWTPDVMRELDHTFGDDGIFWISFAEWLRYFPDFERTRLFGPDWTIAQQWTSVNAPWNTDYIETRFDITLKEKGPAVLVLSQPDKRYFSGLDGRYGFNLHFRLYKQGEETYLVRSQFASRLDRSCSAELELEPGNYQVYVKIEAWRNSLDPTPEEIINRYRNLRRDKLFAIGRSFDLAHAKGRLREKEQQNAKIERDEQRKDSKDEKKRERENKRLNRLREQARRKRVDDELKKRVQIKKAEMQKELDEKKAKKAAAKAAAKAANSAEAKKVADTATAEKAADSASTEKSTENTSATAPVATEAASTNDNPKPTEEKEATAGATKDPTKSPQGGTPSATGEAKVPEPVPSTSKGAKESAIDAAASLPTPEPSSGDSPAAASAEAVEPSETPSKDLEQPSTQPKEPALLSGESGALSEEPTSISEKPGKATEGPSKASAEANKDTKPEEASKDIKADGAKKEIKPEEVSKEGKADETSSKDAKPEDDNNTDKGPAPGGDADKGKPDADESEPDDASIQSDDVTVSVPDDDDFEWNSEIDGDIDPDSDGDDQEEPMYKDDPWRATTVIGLRLYSHDKEAKIRVLDGVERPGMGMRQVSKY